MTTTLPQLPSPARQIHILAEQVAWSRNMRAHVDHYNGLITVIAGRWQLWSHTLADLTQADVGAARRAIDIYTAGFAAGLTSR